MRRLLTTPWLLGPLVAALAVLLLWSNAWRLAELRTAIQPLAPQARPLAPEDAVEVGVHTVVADPTRSEYAVILKVKDAERYLLIGIGPTEAAAILRELEHTHVPRPQTHDLMKSLIDELGGEVRLVVVNDVANQTFYARIVIAVRQEEREIDARPSDAIALALRAEAPIFVRRQVLDAAGIASSESPGIPL
ncbi:MAG: bifunctional nuclease family protein [Chloroflexi bacterium]|nr:bifunctional nuclease family protein [Chloroflexota bacterium]